MTLLNCLVAAIPARERVVTWEEVFELPTASTDADTASGRLVSAPNRYVDGGADASVLQRADG